MPLANGSRTQLRYKPEVTYGVVNVTGGATDLRRTDDSLGYKLQTTMSQEIRADRMTSDLVLVGASADGAVNFELSYAEYDALIAATLQGTMSVYGTNGVGAAIASGTWAANTFTGTALPITNLARGQWVRIKTTVDGGANDLRVLQISRTVAPSATVITFETPISALTAGAAASFSIQTSRVINGIVQPSFTLEREHADLPQFITFRGQTVSKMSLSFASGAIVTGSFEFMGKDQMPLQATTRFTGGASTASRAFDVMNAVTGVGTIMEGGVALAGTFLKSLTLDIDNSLRGRDAVGVLGYAEVASGQLQVTGKASIYFANATIYNKFVNSEATSIALSAQDTAGNGYVFTLPRVKFSEGNIVPGNISSDSMLDMSFTALLDSATGTNHQISVSRIGVAVV